MNDTQFYLDQAYMIFLSFCQESGFVTEEACLSFYYSFSQSLNKALQQQFLRYKEDRTHSPEVEVAKYIGQLYKNRHLKIAESVDVFDCNRHDGVIHNNHLCLRGKVLEKIYPNLNKEEIIQFLLNENALKPGKDKRTIQISKLKGLRFYAVKLESII